jgi:hypothetical protein
MTKWCNNCQSKKDSWSDKNNSGYKHNFRCWSCDKWSLVCHSDKNLYSWWANGISQEQKNAIEKLGIDASGSSNKRYDKQDLLKLWHWTKILERNRQDIGISKKIQQINFFSTEWNNNLTAVIDGEGSYGINLLVYEMPMQATGNPSSGNLEKFFVDSESSFYEIRNKVNNLEKTLKGDNPILYKWNCWSHVYYSYD